MGNRPRSITLPGPYHIQQSAVHCHRPSLVYQNPGGRGLGGGEIIFKLHFNDDHYRTLDTAHRKGLATHMNTPGSMALGWGSLMLASGIAYY